MHELSADGGETKSDDDIDDTSFGQMHLCYTECQSPC